MTADSERATTLVVQGEKGERNQLGALLLAGAFAPVLAEEFSWLVGLIGFIGAVLFSGFVVFPRRRARRERLLAALRDAPDTIVEIAYRRPDKIVVVLSDGTRLTLRFDTVALGRIVAEIAAACPNALVHEGKPGARSLQPATAKLLPPK